MFSPASYRQHLRLRDGVASAGPYCAGVNPSEVALGGPGTPNPSGGLPHNPARRTLSTALRGGFFMHDVIDSLLVAGLTVIAIGLYLTAMVIL